MILKIKKPRTKFWNFEKKHKNIEHMKNKNSYNWKLFERKGYEKHLKKWRLS